MIEIWNTYSCNNSSSFRLVAKFADAARANELAVELRQFFTTHAEEIDQRGDYDEAPSATQRALGARYGYEWGEAMYWGDDGLAGDEPEVFVHEEVLIVQHTYCGGLGDLELFVKATGATATNQDDSRTVAVSLLFRAAPGVNAELDGQLAALFASLDARADKRGEIKAPWAEHETCGHTAWFRDAGTVGLHLQVDPRDLESLTAWLADHGIDRPSLQIDEHGNFTTFEAIGRARCTSCASRLDYLDPRLHDIEAPQLVCTPCGGLYDLATFLPKS